MSKWLACLHFSLFAIAPLNRSNLLRWWPACLQSEDKSVAVWRCDDWSVVASIKTPYARLVSSTFSTRMSWSPDGSFLATGVHGREAVRVGEVWFKEAVSMFKNGSVVWCGW